MLSLFQKATTHFHAKLPFVVYCKPNSDKLIGVFQNDSVLYSIEDFTENGFAFVSFDGTKKCIIPSEHSDVYVKNIEEITFRYPKNDDLPVDDLSKNAFELLVKKGVEAIRKNEFKKVVLSRKETITLKDFDIKEVVDQLHFNYPNAFNYCFYHPEVGMWIGATPEQLLQVNHTKVKAVALAGTQLFSENMEWKSKEKLEQQFVTDFIKLSLEMYCNSVTVSEPYTQKAGAIAHIKSDITAVLNSTDKLGNLITALHPTPAVCGLPKEASQQFILKNEGYDRSFYTGFLGELNIDFSTFRKENSDLFVNLRCMEMVVGDVTEITEAMIYVGCGITIDSIPEREYIETVNKSMTMRKVVNLQG